ncbi:hypothetical protein [Vibrio sp. CAU 1672]|uniref:hypothetical protein n=1 Tax=Vibrio sp. CAU 1672 TaxID=3032594 RepID=UPI0023DBF623|nr:hypothetical protein [Vibrio sp. CAU 1672]MDF2156152.1 hypothetical protein [Vibrio sp. CAU 1672]
MTVVVNSMKELGSAVRKKEKSILIEDRSLAKKVRKFKGVDGLSKGTMTAAGFAALGGMEVVYIVGLLVLGVTVLYAIYKDYNVKIKRGDDEIILERA